MLTSKNVLGTPKRSSAILCQSTPASGLWPSHPARNTCREGTQTHTSQHRSRTQMKSVDITTGKFKNPFYLMSCIFTFYHLPMNSFSYKNKKTPNHTRNNLYSISATSPPTRMSTRTSSARSCWPRWTLTRPALDTSSGRQRRRTTAPPSGISSSSFRTGLHRQTSAPGTHTAHKSFCLYVS